jgi:hypothetical protein
MAKVLSRTVEPQRGIGEEDFLIQMLTGTLRS